MPAAGLVAALGNVLERHQALQADADLVLGPAGQLTQLAAGEADECNGPSHRLAPHHRQQTPCLGGQVVGAAGEHFPAQPDPDGDIARARLHVAHGHPSHVDGAGSGAQCPIPVCMFGVAMRDVAAQDFVFVRARKPAKA